LKATFAQEIVLSTGVHAITTQLQAVTPTTDTAAVNVQRTAIVAADFANPNMVQWCVAHVIWQALIPHSVEEIAALGEKILMENVNVLRLVKLVGTPMNIAVLV